MINHAEILYNQMLEDNKILASYEASPSWVGSNSNIKGKYVILKEKCNCGRFLHMSLSEYHPTMNPLFVKYCEGNTIHCALCGGKYEKVDLDRVR